MGLYNDCTVKDVLGQIKNYVLPAFQRNYVWKDKDIEKLFDSILRGYPINTLLFWEVDSSTSGVFYPFLNPAFVKGSSSKGSVTQIQSKTFAVLDGQQRLTSLNIGLYGTYQGKSLYLHFFNNDFEFKFLSAKAFDKLSTTGKLFKVSDISKYNTFKDFGMFTTSQEYKGCVGNDPFRQVILNSLFSLIYQDTLISYYKVDKSTSYNQVLDIFIRTNQGKTVSPASIAMASITIGIPNINTQIQGIIKKGSIYNIKEDSILKAFLLCFGNGKISYLSIDSTIINNGVTGWSDFENSYDAVLTLLSQWNLPSKALTSDNAIAILVYFVYINKLWSAVNKPLNVNLQGEMRKWLYVVLLKQLFRVSTDSVLLQMKGIIDNNKSTTSFPYAKFKGQSFSGMLFDVTQNDIYDFLETEKDDRNCFLIMSLLFPNLNYNGTVKFDIDHLHPVSAFSVPPKNQDFNKIANLAMQSSGWNRSKGATPLVHWIGSAWVHCGHSINELLIAPTWPLGLSDFAVFYNNRRNYLYGILMNSL